MLEIRASNVFVLCLKNNFARSSLLKDISKGLTGSILIDS
jgi:hypothetical protein